MNQRQAATVGYSVFKPRSPSKSPMHNPFAGFAYVPCGPLCVPLAA